MDNKRDSNEATATTSASAWAYSSAFFLPLILATAYLNMGPTCCGSNCEDNTLKCQGLPVTHIFDDGNGSTYTTTAGNDVILVLAGPVTIHAGAGNDTVCVLPATDGIVIDGGPGDDEIHGGPGDDVLDGGPGDDSISGGAGRDFILGGGGVDTIYGDEGDDGINGEDGNDLIYGGDGDDSLGGGAGDDYIAAGYGDDTLFAGSGSVTGMLNGGPGYDVLTACASYESLISGVEEMHYYDSTACPVEAADVLSARLEISVCDLPYAEKYWRLHASLSAEEVELFGSFAGPPQFDRGSTHFYDLFLPGTVNDIRQIKLRNNWSNPTEDFCVSRVRLGTNHLTEGAHAWKWLFDSGPIETWIMPLGQAGNSVTWSFDDLRANSQWTVSNATTNLQDFLSTGLDYATLERLVESIFQGLLDDGLLDDHAPDAAAARNAEGKWVFASPSTCPSTCFCDPATGDCVNNGAKMHIDLRSGRLVQDWVEIDFTLLVTCDNDALKLTPYDIRVDLDGIAELIEPRIENALRGMTGTLSQTVGLPNGLQCSSLQPQFDDCGLWLGFANLPRPAGVCQ